MSNLNTQVMDQRCSSRMEIGEDVEFRCINDETFQKAKMVDFSESGMFLIMKEKFAENTEFEVRVKKDEEALFFAVKCVRSNPCADLDMFGYGCIIEEHRIES